MAKKTKLTEERANLAEKVSMTYSPNDFPGSKSWMIATAAQKALADFDAAHPEIIADIKTERAAKEKAKTDEIMSRQEGWID